MDIMYIYALALRCRDAAGAVCDLCQMTANDLVALPVYMVKQIIWDCFQRTVYTQARLVKATPTIVGEASIFYVSTFFCHAPI